MSDPRAYDRVMTLADYPQTPAGRLAFYDAQIAPLALSFVQACHSAGFSAIAVANVSPEDYPVTSVMQPDVCPALFVAKNVLDMDAVELGTLFRTQHG